MTRNRGPANRLPKLRKDKRKPLPICTAMLICEQLIIGKDEVPSAIRIVDFLSMTSSDEPKPGTPCQFQQVNLLVILKNDEAEGEVDLKMICKGPSGKRTSVGFAVAQLQGPPEGGVSIASPVRLFWEGHGLYWIELMIGETLIAKTPVRIKGDDAKKG